MCKKSGEEDEEEEDEEDDEDIIHEQVEAENASSFLACEIPAPSIGFQNMSAILMASPSRKRLEEEVKENETQQDLEEEEFEEMGG